MPKPREFKKGSLATGQVASKGAEKKSLRVAPANTGRLRLLWVIGLFMALFCRVGEAHNPGPLSTAGADDEFVLGCLNPTGIMGKAKLCQELPHKHAIWAISETHLSQAGI